MIGVVGAESKATDFGLVGPWLGGPHNVETSSAQSETYDSLSSSKHSGIEISYLRGLVYGTHLAGTY